jgi:hypothetical protein
MADETDDPPDPKKSESAPIEKKAIVNKEDWRQIARTISELRDIWRDPLAVSAWQRQVKEALETIALVPLRLKDVGEAVRQSRRNWDLIRPQLQDAHGNIVKMLAQRSDLTFAFKDFERSFNIEVKTLRQSAQVFNDSFRRTLRDARGANASIVETLKLIRADDFERTLLVILAANINQATLTSEPDTAAIATGLERFLDALTNSLQQIGLDAIKLPNVIAMITLVIMLKAMYIDSPNAGLEDKIERLTDIVDERLQSAVMLRATTEVHLRAEPSMSGAVLETLTLGETVSLVEVEDGWTMVTAIGSDGEPITGYVKSEFLELLPASGPTD